MMLLVLDPDFPCYSILEIVDKDHFVFAYYEERPEGGELPDEVEVSCFEYSAIRGDFRAVRTGTLTFATTERLIHGGKFTLNKGG